MITACRDMAQADMTRLIRAAELRGPVEEDFEFAKDGLGLDQSQVRLYHAILRHTILVMTALAVCAVTAAPAHRPPIPCHPHAANRGFGRDR